MRERTSAEYKASERTLGVANSRHFASILAAAKSSGSGEFISHYLTPQEIDFCESTGKHLPRPLSIKTIESVKHVSIDLFNIRVDQEITERGKRVYVLTGFYDVAHVGYLQQVHFTRFIADLGRFEEKLAKKLAMDLWLASKNNHAKFLFETLVNKQKTGKGLKDGVVVARIESDEYKAEYKKGEVIFPWDFRLGWFEQLPVDWTTVYPTHKNASQSWGYGNKLLMGWPEGIDIKNTLVFVLPLLKKSDKPTEFEAVEKRKNQIEEEGFGVLQIPSQVEDVSSSLLIKKFSLKPVLGF